MSRVAFITGGAGGIGSAVSRVLAADGNHVVVADLSKDASDAVAAEVGGLGVQLDVTDPESVTSAVAAAVDVYGPVQILINVAGWERKMPLVQMDAEHIQRLVDINLLGVIRVTREVFGPMIASGWGRIVNVSSDAAAGAPEYSVYAAAKAGVNAFTKSIAAEVGGAAVTVNAMSPGAINTPLFKSSQGDGYEQTVAIMKQIVPLNRIGEPDEAAAAVRFLASEEASYISAQVLSVNGGMAR